MNDETRKIPEPIIEPMTSMVASYRRRPRTSCSGSDRRSFASIIPDTLWSLHQSHQKAMEAVRALLSRRRVAAAVVETGPNPLLYRLDDRLVLAFDPVETRARAAIDPGWVEHPRHERHPRPVDRQGSDDVDGDSPWIGVDHRVGE